MFEKTTIVEGHTLPQQVWVCLTAERRAQVIRLMAQLAFNAIEAQAVAFGQERYHVFHTQPEDSPRSS